ncbi:MAG: hypothetical protein Q8O67_01020 [Deltaproteobacteria bacterium]|nr:hypothetical protein [Deltaproteobacteria bacterium]
MAQPHALASHVVRSMLVVALLVGAATAVMGVVALSIDPAAVLNSNRARVEALAWKHLHRRLTIGPIEVAWYPTTRLTIHGLELSGLRPGEQPMIELGDIDLHIRLGQAARTLGDEIVIEQLNVTGGVIRVRRAVDGSLDVLDVLAKLPGFDPKQLARDVVLRFRATGGRVEFIDETSELTGATGVVPPTLAFHGLGVTADDLAVGVPVDLHIAGLWAGPDAAVDVDLHIDHVPEDLILWPLPMSDARLRAEGVDLAGLLRVFGFDVLGGFGVLDATLAVDADHHVQAYTDLQAWDFGSSSIGARVISGHLQGLSDLNLETGDIVWDLQVRSDVVNFDALLDRSVEAPQGIRSLFLAADAADLAVTGAMLPWIRDATGLRFSGVGALLVDVDDVDGHAAGWLGLDGADVQIGEALHKHRGQRAHLELIGTRSRDGLETSVNARLPGGVVITGTARALADGVSLELASNTVDVRRAGALSPILHDVLNGLARRGTLRATLRGDLLEFGTKLDLRLAVRDLEVVQQTTRITGNADVAFVVATEQSTGMRLALKLGLDGLDVRTLGEKGELLVEKRAGVPCRIDANLFERGGRNAMARALDQAGATGEIVSGTALSSRWRSIVSGLGGSGRARIDELSLSGISITAINTTVDVGAAGRVRVRAGSFKAMGGTVSVVDSGADLAAYPLTWRARVHAVNVEVAQLVAPVQGVLGAAEGSLFFDAELDGAGVSVSSILGSLEGPVTVTTRGVRFAHLSAVSGVVDSIWGAVAAIPFVNRSMPAAPNLDAAFADGSWTFPLRRGVGFWRSWGETSPLVQRIEEVLGVPEASDEKQSEGEPGVWGSLERALQGAAAKIIRAVDDEVGEAERSVAETIGTQPKQAEPDPPASR